MSTVYWFSAHFSHANINPSDSCDPNEFTVQRRQRQARMRTGRWLWDYWPQKSLKRENIANFLPPPQKRKNREFLQHVPPDNSPTRKPEGTTRSALFNSFAFIKHSEGFLSKKGTINSSVGRRELSMGGLQFAPGIIDFRSDSIMDWGKENIQEICFWNNQSTYKIKNKEKGKYLSLRFGVYN